MCNPVTLTRHGNCGLVTLFSPPVNALSQPVRSGLAAAMNAALEDARVEWVLLQSGGRCFSAGADIKEFGKPPRRRCCPM